MTDASYQIDFIQQKLDKPIVLVGLMGAGKSTVGRLFAEMLSVEFIDSDNVLEIAENRSIPDIFTEQGEAYFRQKERETIASILNDGKAQVIGIGGGAFINDETRNLLKEKAISVFLEANVDVLVERVGSGKGRPLLAEQSPKEALNKLIKERYPIYQEAVITVQTEKETSAQTAEKLLNSLYNHLSQD
ncbi:MAG: shikimate kinase [Pseudomonadota bacterium]